MVKNNSLALDQQCMETRQKLTQHPKGEDLAKPKPKEDTKWHARMNTNNNFGTGQKFST